MQVASGITISTIVDFVGVERLVERIGCLAHISHKEIPLLFADVDDFTDMIFVGHNNAAGLGLFLKEDQLAHPQITDRDTKSRQDLAAHAITALGIFHI